jgi:hypothetical protein
LEIKVNFYHFITASDDSPVVYKDLKQQGGKSDVNYLRLTEMLGKIDSDFISQQDEVITPRPLPKVRFI